MIRRLALLGLLAAAPLSAQTDARLVTAMTLAREGLGDSARAVAGRLLNATAPTDPFHAEALYTVAMVSATAQDKRLHLQRLAVEFSQSAWADDARLELAQLDYAERDPAGTVRQVERLLADYPLSPLRAAAALWGARAALDRRETARACQWTMLGLQAVGDDLELRHQLEYQQQRCGALARGDTAPPVVVTPPPPPSPAPATTRPARQWFIQAAAYGSRAQADRLVARLARARLAALVVSEGGLFKVRVGPYPGEAAAQAALPAVRREVGDGPFVVPPR